MDCSRGTARPSMKLSKSENTQLLVTKAFMLNHRQADTSPPPEPHTMVEMLGGTHPLVSVSAPPGVSPDCLL